jgi:ATP-dependent RNA helicase RhlE
MQNFSELSLSTAIHHNLARNGFVVPTPIQAQAIPPALTGVDVVATAQTGTGKTLAFVLPILQTLTSQPSSKNIQALILSPTRELAIQIQEVFARISAGLGIRPVLVVGGLSERPQLQSLKQGAQVVIATPGRLEDFVRRGLVKLNHVSVLVLDEADRMLDMGFLPAIERIVKELPTVRQNLFYSATIEKSVAHLINKYTNDPVRVTIGSTVKAADSVELNFFEVENDKKLDLLNHLITNEAGSFLVFARTKHGTDKLAKRLTSAGIKTCCMHGDRSQNQRNQALEGFRKGYYRVLVATDVAARGIHVDDVAHVVNYDLPQVPEDYIHRVGRTGRAGRKGVAWTFGSRHERNDIRRIESALKTRLVRLDIPSGIVQLPREMKVVSIEEAPKHEYGARKQYGAGKPSRSPFGSSKPKFGAPKGKFGGTSRFGTPKGKSAWRASRPSAVQASNY